MSTIATRITEEEQKINHINEEIRQLGQKVTKSYLEPILAKQQQFQINKSGQLHQQPQLHNNGSDAGPKDLHHLSITQLNTESELIHEQIQELEKLNQIKTNLEEIEQLLSNLQLSINSLLDLQHLYQLFKQIQDFPTANYMIYKQIVRKVAALHLQFVDKLNEYLTLILPNEFTILHASAIGDFNQFVIKNGCNLSVYANYRTKWDEMIDAIFNNQQEVDIVKEDDVDSEEMEIKLTKGTDFITSLINFVKFINKVNHPPIKNYLNSKISKLVAGRLFHNVEAIVHDKQRITQLNELINLCEETSWNFMNKIEGGGTMEERLNKLHLEWVIDDYVGKIRRILATASFGELKYAEEAIVDKKSEEEPEEKIVANEDTDWDESWDDKWDEEGEEEEEQTQAKEAHESKQPDDYNKQNNVKISPVP
ncbi:hypothetical protein KGF57_001069 [Candida theae]|uniref:Uncharacterized protein n=1 Tax=Candida theae TaxID=1198502 RepID=A0AAD5BHN8_9ASCO|nr:uncharacterized protein KGF57_001069 [Candida theae]KAI5964396.1 hypothetical protein KGF57_001069 [Candida theae]